MYQLRMFLQQLRLYSVQAMAFLAMINSFYVFLQQSAPDLAAQVPAWIIWVLNVAALAYGYYGRQVPQPEAAARIEALRAAR